MNDLAKKDAPQQLSLRLVDNFSYTPDRFVVHQGIKDLVSKFDITLDSPTYQMHFILAPERVGKTHLGIFLASRATEKGLVARLSSGKEFAALIDSINSKSAAIPDLLVVDDADFYLKDVAVEASGPFVTFVELFRRKASKIVLLSSKSIDELQCDDHIKSRLRAANGEVIGSPEDSELEALIECMAKQRGIALASSKISYLSKRVGRSVSALEQCLERLSMMGQMSEKLSSFDVLHVVI